MSRPQQVGVSVDNHHRVVHYHTQHGDERSQGHRVQFEAYKIHNAQRSSNADRYRCGTDQGSPQREKHKHHKDDDKDGFKEVFEE